MTTMSAATSALADPATSLDVFILTFNAGKKQIDPCVFARHLGHAFTENATSLPELVVLCLQEMAPLAHSFIGSYMISPYFQNYVSAVNLAAGRHAISQDQDRQDGLAASPEESPQGPQAEYQNHVELGYSPYTLVTTRNVGMTGIMLFARDPGALHNLASTEVSFGAGEIASKGAVGLRVTISKGDSEGRIRQTELTFVGTHLAAHEWNLEKRNKDWATIVSGLLFEPPGELHDSKSARSTQHTSSEGDERAVLLSPGPSDESLHDMTIYKPGSHLFVAGDLNYRISEAPPKSESEFPDLDPESPNYFQRFLALDQLSSEKAAGRTLHGLHEPTILFPPTYKLEVAHGLRVQTHQQTHDGLSWKWASHRWPGWCDRVLYLDVPRWVSETSATTEIKMNMIAYDALPPVRTSDHRAVFLRIDVPVLEPSILTPSPELRTLDSNDPRINLPYPVDFRARDHRMQIKRWESVIGWSLLLTQSKQGITAFVALLFVGLAAWWLRPR